MVIRDILKVLKLHSSKARAILRTFKIPLDVLVNHEMHSLIRFPILIHRDALHRLRVNSFEGRWS